MPVPVVRAPPAPESPKPIADRPLEGTIGGRSFRPNRVEARYHEKLGGWELALYQDAGPGEPAVCGRSRRRPPSSPDTLIVTILAISTVGATRIAMGDMHHATFQVGFFVAGEDGRPRTITGREGELRIDVWSEQPSGRIAGALRLVGDDAEVDGTFTGSTCARD